MLKHLMRLFAGSGKSLPNSEAQVNIANLALYHLDKALTRIEVLFTTGRNDIALNEYEALRDYLVSWNNPEGSADFLSRLNTSSEMTAAIQYIDKLYRLLGELLQAGRLTEAHALNAYLNKIRKRIEKLGERFPVLLQILTNRRRATRSNRSSTKRRNFPVDGNRRN